MSNADDKRRRRAEGGAVGRGSQLHMGAKRKLPLSFEGESELPLVGRRKAAAFKRTEDDILSKFLNLVHRTLETPTTVDVSVSPLISVFNDVISEVSHLLTDPESPLIGHLGIEQLHRLTVLMELILTIIPPMSYEHEISLPSPEQKESGSSVTSSTMMRGRRRGSLRPLPLCTSSSGSSCSPRIRTTTLRFLSNATPYIASYLCSSPRTYDTLIEIVSLIEMLEAERDAERDSSTSKVGMVDSRRKALFGELSSPNPSFHMLPLSATTHAKISSFIFGGFAANSSPTAGHRPIPASPPHDIFSSLPMPPLEDFALDDATVAEADSEAVTFGAPRPKLKAHPDIDGEGALSALLQACSSRLLDGATCLSKHAHSITIPAVHKPLGPASEAIRTLPLSISTDDEIVRRQQITSLIGRIIRIVLGMEGESRAIQNASHPFPLQGSASVIQRSINLIDDLLAVRRTAISRAQDILSLQSVKPPLLCESESSGLLTAVSTSILDDALAIVELHDTDTDPSTSILLSLRAYVSGSLLSTFPHPHDLAILVASDTEQRPGQPICCLVSAENVQLAVTVLQEYLKGVKTEPADGLEDYQQLPATEALHYTEAKRMIGRTPRSRAAWLLSRLGTESEAIDALLLLLILTLRGAEGSSMQTKQLIPTLTTLIVSISEYCGEAQATLDHAAVFSLRLGALRLTAQVPQIDNVASLDFTKLCQAVTRSSAAQVQRCHVADILLSRFCVVYNSTRVLWPIYVPLPSCLLLAALIVMLPDLLPNSQLPHHIFEGLVSSLQCRGEDQDEAFDVQETGLGQTHAEVLAVLASHLADDRKWTLIDKLVGLVTHFSNRTSKNTILLRHLLLLIEALAAGQKSSPRWGSGGTDWPGMAAVPRQQIVFDPLIPLQEVPCLIHEAGYPSIMQRKDFVEAIGNLTSTSQDRPILSLLALRVLHKITPIEASTQSQLTQILTSLPEMPALAHLITSGNAALQASESDRDLPVMIAQRLRGSLGRDIELPGSVHELTLAYEEALTVLLETLSTNDKGCPLDKLSEELAESIMQAVRRHTRLLKRATAAIWAQCDPAALFDVDIGKAKACAMQRLVDLSVSLLQLGRYQPHLQAVSSSVALLHKGIAAVDGTSPDLLAVAGLQVPRTKTHVSDQILAALDAHIKIEVSDVASDLEQVIQSHVRQLLGHGRVLVGLAHIAHLLHKRLECVLMQIGTTDEREHTKQARDDVQCALMSIEADSSLAWLRPRLQYHATGNCFERGKLEIAGLAVQAALGWPSQHSAEVCESQQLISVLQAALVTQALDNYATSLGNELGRANIAQHLLGVPQSSLPSQKVGALESLLRLLLPMQASMPSAGSDSILSDIWAATIHAVAGVCSDAGVRRTIHMGQLSQAAAITGQFAAHIMDAGVESCTALFRFCLLGTTGQAPHRLLQQHTATLITQLSEVESMSAHRVHNLRCLLAAALQELLPSLIKQTELLQLNIDELTCWLSCAAGQEVKMCEILLMCAEDRTCSLAVRRICLDLLQAILATDTKGDITVETESQVLQQVHEGERCNERDSGVEGKSGEVVVPMEIDEGHEHLAGYLCHTCSPSVGLILVFRGEQRHAQEANYACCRACADTCHDGHDVSFVGGNDIRPAAEQKCHCPAAATGKRPSHCAKKAKEVQAVIQIGPRAGYRSSGPPTRQGATLCTKLKEARQRHLDPSDTGKSIASSISNAIGRIVDLIETIVKEPVASETIEMCSAEAVIGKAVAPSTGLEATGGRKIVNSISLERTHDLLAASRHLESGSLDVRCSDDSSRNRQVKTLLASGHVRRSILAADHRGKIAFVEQDHIVVASALPLLLPPAVSDAIVSPQERSTTSSARIRGGAAPQTNRSKLCILSRTNTSFCPVGLAFNSVAPEYLAAWGLRDCTVLKLDAMGGIAMRTSIDPTFDTVSFSGVVKHVRWIPSRSHHLCVTTDTCIKIFDSTRRCGTPTHAYRAASADSTIIDAVLLTAGDANAAKVSTSAPSASQSNDKDDPPSEVRETDSDEDEMDQEHASEGLGCVVLVLTKTFRLYVIRPGIGATKDNLTHEVRLEVSLGTSLPFPASVSSTEVADTPIAMHFSSTLRLVLVGLMDRVVAFRLDTSLAHVERGFTVFSASSLSTASITASIADLASLQLTSRSRMGQFSQTSATQGPFLRFLDSESWCGPGTSVTFMIAKSTLLRSERVLCLSPHGKELDRLCLQEASTKKIAEATGSIEGMCVSVIGGRPTLIILYENGSLQTFVRPTPLTDSNQERSTSESPIDLTSTSVSALAAIVRRRSAADGDSTPLTLPTHTKGPMPAKSTVKAERLAEALALLEGRAVSWAMQDDPAELNFSSSFSDVGTMPPWVSERGELDEDTGKDSPSFSAAVLSGNSADSRSRGPWPAVTSIEKLTKVGRAHGLSIAAYALSDFSCERLLRLAQADAWPTDSTEEEERNTSGLSESPPAAIISSCKEGLTMAIRIIDETMEIAHISIGFGSSMAEAVPREVRIMGRARRCEVGKRRNYNLPLTEQEIGIGREAGMVTIGWSEAYGGQGSCPVIVDSLQVYARRKAEPASAENTTEMQVQPEKQEPTPALATLSSSPESGLWEQAALSVVQLLDQVLAAQAPAASKDFSHKYRNEVMRACGDLFTVTWNKMQSRRLLREHVKGLLRQICPSPSSYTDAKDRMHLAIIQKLLDPSTAQAAGHRAIRSVLGLNSAVALVRRLLARRPGNLYRWLPDANHTYFGSCVSRLLLVAPFIMQAAGRQKGCARLLERVAGEVVELGLREGAWQAAQDGNSWAESSVMNAFMQLLQCRTSKVSNAVDIQLQQLLWQRMQPAEEKTGLPPGHNSLPSYDENLPTGPDRAEEDEAVAEESEDEDEDDVEDEEDEEDGEAEEGQYSLTTSAKTRTEREEEERREKRLEYRCDGCDDFPLTGSRWTCEVCADFDLCHHCYEQGDVLIGNHGPHHTMVRMPTVPPIDQAAIEEEKVDVSEVMQAVNVKHDIGGTDDRQRVRQNAEDEAGLDSVLRALYRRLLQALPSMLRLSEDTMEEGHPCSAESTINHLNVLLRLVSAVPESAADRRLERPTAISELVTVLCKCLGVGLQRLSKEGKGLLARSAGTDSVLLISQVLGYIISIPLNSSSSSTKEGSIVKNDEHMATPVAEDKTPSLTCKAHKLPLQRRIWSHGRFQGRPFLSCQLPRNRRCQHFAWAATSDDPATQQQSTAACSATGTTQAAQSLDAQSSSPPAPKAQVTFLGHCPPIGLSKAHKQIRDTLGPGGLVRFDKYVCELVQQWLTCRFEQHEPYSSSLSRNLLRSAWPQPSLLDPSEMRDKQSEKAISLLHHAGPVLLASLLNLLAGICRGCGSRIPKLSIPASVAPGEARDAASHWSQKWIERLCAIIDGLPVSRVADSAPPLAKPSSTTSPSVLKAAAKRLLRALVCGRAAYQRARDLYRLTKVMQTITKLVEQLHGPSVLTTTTVGKVMLRDVPYADQVELCGAIAALGQIIRVRLLHWQQLMAMSEFPFCLIKSSAVSLGVPPVRIVLRLSGLLDDHLQLGCLNLLYLTASEDEEDSDGDDDDMEADTVGEAVKLAVIDEMTVDYSAAARLLAEDEEGLGKHMLAWIPDILSSRSPPILRELCGKLLRRHWPDLSSQYKDKLLADLAFRLPTLPTFGQHGIELLSLLHGICLREELVHICSPATCSRLVSTLLQTLAAQYNALSNSPYKDLHSTMRLITPCPLLGINAQPCPACLQHNCASTPAVLRHVLPGRVLSSSSSSSKALALESLRHLQRANENSITVLLKAAQRVEKITLRVNEPHGRYVKTVLLSFCSRTATNFADLTAEHDGWYTWQRLTTLHLSPGQLSAEAELPVPAIVGCLLIEYHDFHSCSGLSARGARGARSSGGFHCPNCARQVLDPHGFCRHCGEVAFQCRQCRHINYERLDAFLCMECGYCAYGQFYYRLLGAPASSALPILSKEEVEPVLKQYRTSMCGVQEVHGKLLTCVPEIRRLLGEIHVRDDDINEVDREIRRATAAVKEYINSILPQALAKAIGHLPTRNPSRLSPSTSPARPKAARFVFSNESLPEAETDDRDAEDNEDEEVEDDLEFEAASLGLARRARLVAAAATHSVSSLTRQTPNLGLTSMCTGARSSAAYEAARTAAPQARASSTIATSTGSSTGPSTIVAGTAARSCDGASRRATPFLSHLPDALGAAGATPEFTNNVGALTAAGRSRTEVAGRRTIPRASTALPASSARTGHSTDASGLSSTSLLASAHRAALIRSARTSASLASRSLTGTSSISLPAPHSRLSGAFDSTTNTTETPIGSSAEQVSRQMPTATTASGRVLSRDNIASSAVPVSGDPDEDEMEEDTLTVAQQAVLEYWKKNCAPLLDRLGKHLSGLSEASESLLSYHRGQIGGTVVPNLAQQESEGTEMTSVTGCFECGQQILIRLLEITLALIEHGASALSRVQLVGPRSLIVLLIQDFILAPLPEVRALARATVKALCLQENAEMEVIAEVHQRLLDSLAQRARSTSGIEEPKAIQYSIELLYELCILSPYSICTARDIQGFILHLQLPLRILKHLLGQIEGNALVAAQIGIPCLQTLVVLCHNKVSDQLQPFKLTASERLLLEAGYEKLLAAILQDMFTVEMDDEGLAGRSASSWLTVDQQRLHKVRKLQSLFRSRSSIAAARNYQPQAQTQGREKTTSPLRPQSCLLCLLVAPVSSELRSMAAVLILTVLESLRGQMKRPHSPMRAEADEKLGEGKDEMEEAGISAKLDDMETRMSISSGKDSLRRFTLHSHHTTAGDNRRPTDLHLRHSIILTRTADVLLNTLSKVTSQRSPCREHILPLFGLLQCILTSAPRAAFLVKRGGLRFLCAITQRELDHLRWEEQCCCSGVVRLQAEDPGIIFMHLVFSLKTLLTHRAIQARLPHHLTSLLRLLVELRLLIVLRSTALEAALRILEVLITPSLSEQRSESLPFELSDESLSHQKQLGERQAYLSAATELLIEYTKPPQLWEDHHLPAGTDRQLYLLRQMCQMISPPRPRPRFRIQLRRAPSQDEFFRGSLSRNPIWMTDIPLADQTTTTGTAKGAAMAADDDTEPLMRDLRAMIARDLGIVDSMELLELLVGGQIIGLDVPMRLVWSQVWKPWVLDRHADSFGVGDGSMAPEVFPSMLVTYRLAGVDGEATEEVVEQLEDEREAAEAASSIAAEVGKVTTIIGTRPSGLRTLLTLVQPPEEATESSAAWEVASVATTILRHSAKSAANRAQLVAMNAPATLLTHLLTTLRLSHSRVAAASALAFGLTDRLLHVIQELGTHTEGPTWLDSEAAEDDVQTANSAGADTSCQVTAFLDTLSDGTLAEVLQRNPVLIKAVGRLLPFLTYGREGSCKTLADRINVEVDWQALTTTSKVEGSETEDSRIALRRTVILESLAGLEGDARGQLRNQLLENGFAGAVIAAFRQGLPASGIIEALAESANRSDFMRKKESIEAAWKVALEQPRARLSLRVLVGLVRGHKPTQGLVISSGILPTLHGLEELTFSGELGSLAEELLELVAAQSPGVATVVRELRSDTRAHKRRLAQQNRKRALSSLGLLPPRSRSGSQSSLPSAPPSPTSVDAAASGAAESDQTPAVEVQDRAGRKIRKLSSGSVKEAKWQMEVDKLEEESGLACMVCQEGYKLKPKCVLGTYIHTKAIPNTDVVALEADALLTERKPPTASCESSRSLIDSSSSSRPTRANCRVVTTVTAFNLIHFACHLEACRADRALKQPKSEWDGATLRNSRISCNGMLPLRGPRVSAEAYRLAVEKHFSRLQALTHPATLSRLSLVTHDLRFLLLRLAFQENLRDDTCGGSLSSNLKLFPYQAQLGHYVLERIALGDDGMGSSEDVSRLQEALNKFLVKAPVACQVEERSHRPEVTEAATLMPVLAIFLLSPSAWAEAAIQAFLPGLLMHAGVRMLKRKQGSGALTSRRRSRSIVSTGGSGSNPLGPTEGSGGGRRRSRTMSEGSDLDADMSSAGPEEQQKLMLQSARPMMVYMALMQEFMRRFKPIESNWAHWSSGQSTASYENDCDNIAHCEEVGRLYEQELCSDNKTIAQLWDKIHSKEGSEPATVESAIVHLMELGMETLLL